MIARKDPRVFLKQGMYDASVYSRYMGTYMHEVSDGIWTPEDRQVCAVPSGYLPPSRKFSKDRGYLSYVMDSPHNGVKELKDMLKRYGLYKASAALSL